MINLVIGFLVGALAASLVWIIRLQRRGQLKVPLEEMHVAEIREKKRLIKRRMLRNYQARQAALGRKAVNPGGRYQQFEHAWAKRPKHSQIPRNHSLNRKAPKRQVPPRPPRNSKDGGNA